MDFKLNSGIFIIHKVFELSAGLQGYAYPFFVMFAHKKTTTTIPTIKRSSIEKQNDSV